MLQKYLQNSIQFWFLRLDPKQDKIMVSIFYLSFYLFLYAIHYLWNIQEFQIWNEQKKHTLHWLQLYPWNCISVYFVGLYYLLFSAIAYGLYRLLFPGVVSESLPLQSFLRRTVNQYLFFVCVLFLGNRFLSFFSGYPVYLFFILIFWVSLFFLFLRDSILLFQSLSQRKKNKLPETFGVLTPVFFVLLGILVLP